MTFSIHRNIALTPKRVYRNTCIVVDCGYNESMRVGIREFKSRAVELVRRAEAGEEVTITRGAQPVAVLKSPKEMDQQARDVDTINRLVAVGLVIPPDPSTRHSKPTQT